MYDFKNKAVKCDKWAQMEHLAELAEKQGLVVDGLQDYSLWKYFRISKKGSFYSNFPTTNNLPEIPYSDFIAQAQQAQREASDSSTPQWLIDAAEKEYPKESWTDYHRNAYIKGAMSDKWIRVEDKLPMDYMNVLAYRVKKQECVVAFVLEGAWHLADQIITTTINVTHWQPLPHPPIS